MGNKMPDNKKKKGNFEVDGIVRDRFAAAVKFTGMSTNQAIEEAMKLFTDRHITTATKNPRTIAADGTPTR